MLESQLRASATQLVDLQENAASYDPAFLNEDVKHYNKIRSHATIGFSVFVALVAILAAFTTCTSRLGYMQT